MRLWTQEPTGEILGVYCEDVGPNRPRLPRTALSLELQTNTQMQTQPLNKSAIYFYMSSRFKYMFSQSVVFVNKTQNLYDKFTTP